MLRNALLLVLLTATSTIAAGQTPQRPTHSHKLQVVSDPIEMRPKTETQPQQLETLSLADLEAIALQNNPTLAVAAARMDMARGRQVQAGLYPNPVVGYHGVEMGLRGTAGQQGGFINQQIITGGKLGLDREIAGKEIDEAHFQFHAQEQRILTDLRLRFYDSLVAQRRVSFAKELTRIGDELVSATEKLIEVRQGSVNDLLQAEIRSDESHILLDNALNQNAEAWRRLVTVAGVPAMHICPVSGELEADLPGYDWENCYSTLLSGNPALQVARIRADRARIVISRARREPIPNIELSVSHRHHNVTDDSVTNVQVGIPLPIFNRNQGNIRSAEAEWVAACNDIKRIELDLHDRLAVAYRRYSNAQQQADRYRKRMVPRARRSLQLVTEGYESGQIKYLPLLTAQQTYLSVNLSYLDSLHELRAAAAIIDGQLLSESLAKRP